MLRTRPPHDPAPQEAEDGEGVPTLWRSLRHEHRDVHQTTHARFLRLLPLAQGGEAVSRVKPEQRDAEIFRRKVRELLASGASIAKIMKATGKSYAHVTRIVEQERVTLDPTETESVNNNAPGTSGVADEAASD